MRTPAANTVWTPATFNFPITFNQIYTIHVSRHNCPIGDFSDTVSMTLQSVSTQWGYHFKSTSQITVGERYAHCIVVIGV